jgi:hypothetical protein
MNVSMIVAVSVCIASALPAVSSAADTGSTPQSRPCSAFEIRHVIDGTLAAETAATTSEQRVAALRDMIALSQEIAAHPSLGKHAAASLCGRLAARLKRAARELAADAENDAAKSDTAKNVATVKPLDKGDVIAQRIGGAPLAAGRVVDGGEALADAIQDTVAPPSWERNGGPGVIALFGGGAHGGNGLLAQVPPRRNNAGALGGPAPLALSADASGELIDLIQQVIAPQSWDVNGGPGAAIFFAPKNALVIRQTGEVQEALVDVVGQLRRNR